MIGEIRKAITPWFNTRKGRMEFKARPALVVAQADEGDYVVLPISRINDSSRIDAKYDVPMKKDEYPLADLSEDSFIRTHKQTIVNSSQLIDTICNLKEIYEDLYLKVLILREDFSKEISKQAL